jgi:ATP-dependent Clp endopeptidase proteolytic subunit ClpP
MRDQFWGDNEKKELPKRTIFDTHGEKINANNDDYNTVDTQDNKIFFYSGVSRPKVLKLNKAIDTLNTTSAMRKASHGIDIPIRIHINSYGGSVFAGLAAVDYIKTSKAEVHTIIDGCAASAATLMSVVANRRFMHRNACMLIHQLSGAMWGKFAAMKDDMQNSEMLMEKIKKIYREHTRIPEDVLESILEHDLWWEAEKCLEYGLIDEIV